MTKKKTLVAIIVIIWVVFTLSELFLNYRLIQETKNTDKRVENNPPIEQIIKVEQSIKEGDDIGVPKEVNKVLPTTVIMDVPKYEQTHNASCEFASAYASMKYFEVDISENDLIAEIEADLSPRYFDENGDLHWGNPQAKFVGDIDGEVVYVDGYGVYNEPIYKVLANHGFSSSISKVNWKVDELYDYIRQGYPAIVWISNDYQEKEVGTMIASDGTKNPWIMGEHAVVLRGVDPSGVYIMDVGNGSHYMLTKEKFKTGFANLGNMAIVVRKDF